MNRVIIFAAMLALACVGNTAAQAKVDRADDNGFVVSFDLDVAATPDALWASLMAPKLWWSGEHSWSGNATNFWMKPVQGGCFCETLPKTNGQKSKDGKTLGFVEHARVIYVDQSKQLRLSGVLGPLQSEGLVGTLSYTITPAPDNSQLSKLKVEYVVGGYSRIPLKSVAPAVDKVLSEQIMQLKAVAEQGIRRR